MFKIIPNQLNESLPGYTWKDRPDHLKTRKEWLRTRRKVRRGEKPVARLTWETLELRETESFPSDGTVTPTKHRVAVIRECGLFDTQQTNPYRGTPRTWAIGLLGRYFVENSSSESFIWWKSDHWHTCLGKLQEWQWKKHLGGQDRYGIRGGKWTRFLAIDLDLHNGDQGVFLDQLRVLLREFHGKDGWHFQVADQDARGIHLIRCFRKKADLTGMRQELRRELQELDRQHRELAGRARAANMKTLGELEIFPDPKKGFRLPLCSGRTMLLDRPLPLIFNKRMGREVQDVIGYISWLSRDEKCYMPAEDVLAFVEERLAPPNTTQSLKVQPPSQQDETRDLASSGLAELGPMKGQFAQKLVEFWTGKIALPDALNQGIVLLARVLPFYLDDEEDAVALIDRFLEELPDVSFSDRLSGGNRAEVSRVVRNTVHAVYRNNGGQANSETSTKKLKATVVAWRKRGFDPTNKATWSSAAVNNLPELCVNNFVWRAEDVIKLGLLQEVLHADMETVSKAIKYLLSLVKQHPCEIAITLVKKVLERFGISCGHHGKVNKLMALLCEWKWIYVRASEQWHSQTGDGKKRKGRARSYGIGAEMMVMFQDMTDTGDNTHN